MNESPSVPVRRRHSKTEISRIVSNYQSGSSTQRELAAQHGVSVGTIQNWLRRHRPQPALAGSGWIEVLPQAPRTTGTYRVELSNGHTLVLGESWQASHVRELVKAISCL